MRRRLLVGSFSLFSVLSVLPVLLVFLVFLGGACGDDGPAAACGVAAGTPAGAATIAIGSDTVSYVGFQWGQNNDCTAAGASVVSVTLRGHQSDAPDFGLGLCLPRPDRIGATPVDLADASLVRLVGAGAQVGGCQVGMAPDSTPTGSVTFAGFCTESGTRFLVSLSGQTPGIETCGSGPSQQVTMLLGGQVLVEAQP